MDTASLPILTIVGATGIQGQSVLNSALRAGSYKIRAITRNPNSQAAKKLEDVGVEVAKADLNDLSSLINAFEGTTYLFAMTNFFEPFAKHDAKTAMEIEVTQGVNIAKAAADCSTLKHYIWSTLPHASKISKGEWPVPHFDGKAQVNDYIKGEKQLWEKTTFLWVSSYASNFTFPMFTPNLLKSSGVYVQLSVVPSSLKLPTIGNPLTNIGRFAISIFEQPGLTLPGKFVFGTSSETTMGEMLESFSAVTGKPSKYVEVKDIDDYYALWPKWGEEIGAMMKYFEKTGEKAWTVEENDKIVTRSDLGLDGHKDFEGIEAALRTLNWKELL